MALEEMGRDIERLTGRRLKGPDDCAAVSYERHPDGIHGGHLPAETAETLRRKLASARRAIETRRRAGKDAGQAERYADRVLARLRRMEERA
jgi:hypothetical protein